MRSNRSASIPMMIAVAVTAMAGAAWAQTPATTEANPAPRAEAPTKVYHAGGRHDQSSHVAAVRAKQTGKKMEAPAVHAGGRHDEAAHKAAIKADNPPATR